MSSAERRLRLCHLHLLPLLSGPQYCSIELFKFLPPDRYDIHVTLSGPGEFADHLKTMGVTVHQCPDLVREISPIADIQALVSLVRLFRRERFDLVHTHSSKTGVLGRLAARLARVPAVIHQVHGFAFHEFSSAATRMGFGLIEMVASRLCDHVIFVSDEERRWAIARRIVSEARSSTIYNGADLSLFSPAVRSRLRDEARQKLGVSRGQSAVTFLGRLWEQKNPGALVPTLAELCRRFPRLDPVLLIAGEGPLRAEVEAAARQLGVADRVRFLGWRSDVHLVLAASDIVYSPSLWEGLPRTLVEAACMGVPAVATDIKGNREVIVDDATGALIAPHDPQAAASALGGALSSPGQLAVMGEAAARRGAELFDSRKTALWIETLYDKKQRFSVSS